MLFRNYQTFNLFQGSSARFVLPAILGQTEGLAGNSKPIYEVYDSISEKSAPMYCLDGTPLRYSAFAWIVQIQIRGNKIRPPQRLVPTSLENTPPGQEWNATSTMFATTNTISLSTMGQIYFLFRCDTISFTFFIMKQNFGPNWKYVAYSGNKHL